MTKAIINPASVDPVVEIGLRIGALTERGSELEKATSAAFQQGGPEATEPFRRASGAVWRELAAAEDYAMAMPCHTLAGAAVQLLLAYNRCDLAENETEDPDARAYITDISRVLRGCMKVVAAAANFDLEKAGGSYYASDYTDPRPVVDLVTAE